ncbi:type I methionyl aminopeptidase [Micrococcoides hystricis]|uniref:Methionine aminopeptidase n=1 Tax=Micrococcoides hystricis TaxID=1572761 RepID=A0ABV6P9F5_9MICC
MFRRKIELKTPKQQKIMAEAGLILADALDRTVAAVEDGISTAELDAIFSAAITEAGTTSNFLGYHGFPGTICTSINEEAVHGIPSKDVIVRNGDVLKIDGGCILNGWHADSARTVLVGEKPDPEDVRLSEVTKNAMWAGIAALANATHIGQVGIAIEEAIEAAPGKKLGILRDYAGHGIGSEMHMEPDVLNYAAHYPRPIKIKPGMCFCIEPITSLGSEETLLLEDEWTVVTADGSNTCQWEHAVAVHKDGIWVLTAPDGGEAGLAPFGIKPTPISI